MDTGIKEFYNNKTILLTGGSGFLGKVVVEKLLRATEVSRIYVIVRPKRGKNTHERINEWKTDPLFELVLKTKPNALKRIVAISGDCKEPDLGISIEDRKLLKRQTNVVIHSAASVNFADPLHMALDTNTRATRLMLQLAREMTHLQAFVHVSTAFSNCVIHHLEERFYPNHLNCSADKVLTLREICDERVFEDMENILMDKFPNTYTYTKALAEQVVQMESAGMPVCVFRPGAIVATSDEPMPGWIDNLYGPIAFLYGAAMGILRVAPVNRDALSSTVPVDYCANLVIACAWKTAKEAEKRKSHTFSVDPTVYNFVPHDKNLLKNGDFWNNLEKHRSVIPLTKSLWYPYLIATSIHWLFKVLAFFLHIVPGFIVDVVLRLRGKKPRLLKLYKKVHKTMDVLVPFSVHNWSFDTINAYRLWKSMSKEDQSLFQFDMRTLDWDDYFKRALTGMRLYLAKDDPTQENLERAKKRLISLRRRHRVSQVIALFILAATLKWFIGALITINRNYNVDKLL